jgi:hypothetical protein
MSLDRHLTPRTATLAYRGVDNQTAAPLSEREFTAAAMNMR